MRPPFERIDPRGPETPVIVEIPHAGLESFPPFLEPLVAAARSIARDADLYVDSLYSEAPDAGATVLVARTSRYVIDVNRSETDVDGEVVEGARSDVRLHHGLIWRTTSDGDPAMSRRLTARELEERLDIVWRPYHRELASIVAHKMARFGIAVILAAQPRRRGARDARAPQRRGPVHRRRRGARRGARVDRPSRRSVRRWLHDPALRPPPRGRPRGSGRALPQALCRRDDAPAAADFRLGPRLVQPAREQAR
jgi:N-formylglutamate deformylase